MITASPADRHNLARRYAVFFYSVWPAPIPEPAVEIVVVFKEHHLS